MKFSRVRLYRSDESTFPRFYINAVQPASFLCCLYISLQHRPDSVSPSGCLRFHTNANDLLLVQKTYLFSLKLLLLVYFCSCSSAGGRLSHNFFLMSAVNAMMPNYDRLLYLDVLMCRQKLGNVFPWRYVRGVYIGNSRISCTVSFVIPISAFCRLAFQLKT
jgi:hypothetical protein